MIRQNERIRDLCEQLIVLWLSGLYIYNNYYVMLPTRKPYAQY